MIIKKQYDISQAYKIACFAIILIVIGNLVVVLIGDNSLKYIRFLAPVLLLAYTKYKIKVENVGQYLETEMYRKLLRLYIYIVAFTFIYNFFSYDIGYTQRNAFNSLILICPLITTMYIGKYFNYEYLIKLIYLMFYLFIAANLLWVFSKGISFTSALSTLASNFIVNSDFATESIDSLLFCFFVIFFIYVKDWKHMVIALIMMILGAKRVALGGSVVAIFVYYFYNYIFSKKGISLAWIKIYAIIFTLLSFIITNFWLLLYSGEFDNTISQYTGLSANAFLEGRQDIANAYFGHAKNVDDYHIGLGLGYVENVLQYKANFLFLFHNDFLRLYLEFGLIPFVLWIYIMFRYALTSALSISVFSLLLVLMQTDNVIVYDKVMVAFYLIFAVGIRSNSKLLPIANKPKYGRLTDVRSST